MLILLILLFGETMVQIFFHRSTILFCSRGHIIYMGLFLKPFIELSFIWGQSKHSCPSFKKGRGGRRRGKV